MDLGIGNIGAEQAKFASANQRSDKLMGEVSKASPEEASEKMEALFASMLVKELRRALPEGGFFGDGPGADTYNGWLDQHLGDALAKSGSLDMAGLVKTALSAKAVSGTEDKPMVVRDLREPSEAYGVKAPVAAIDLQQAQFKALEEPLVIRGLDEGATR